MIPNCMRLIASAILSLGATPTPAQNTPGWPTRPIRMIVPQPPGGSTDVIARVIAQRMSEALGYPVIIDNRPGAGTIVGVELVAHAAPDGHTLLAVASSYSIIPALHKKLPFDPLRDLAPVTQIATLPHVLVVHPSVRAQSVKELIALAKSSPGKLNYASSGFGTSTHMAAELFMFMTGVNMVNITYKGGASAMVAMLAGECQVNFATISTAMPHVNNGRLRALAVTSAKRSAAAPDLPAIADNAIPGYDHASWIGLFAPAKTPAFIMAKLNSETVKAARSPEVKTVLSSDGLEATGTTTEAFAALVKIEIGKWLQIAGAAKLAAR
jgi:tripartite-type tricarboxylate transporter receptor subunit TctC